MIQITSDLELEHQSHRYRLVSDDEGLLFVIPNLAAVKALLGIAEAESWMLKAEELLKMAGTTVRITYQGLTLMTLGQGSWSFAAVSQGLKWLR
jgi:hypothetical protein